MAWTRLLTAGILSVRLKSCGYFVASLRFPAWRVAAAIVAPWRDASDNLKFKFTFEGTGPRTAKKARLVVCGRVSPQFFTVLGVPVLTGRSSRTRTAADTELMAIVSQSVVLFPNGDAINRRMWFTTRGTARPCIVGIVGDVDDQRLQNPSR